MGNDPPDTERRDRNMVIIIIAGIILGIIGLGLCVWSIVDELINGNSFDDLAG